ncbi:uncharacterized protein [Palaemon carinicauda]
MGVDTPPPTPECRFLEEKSGMRIFELKKSLLISYEPKIKVMSIGAENNLEIKTIMLLGATGAGKTCLINALANHILGVKFEDNFRYSLKDETGEGKKSLAESQTEYVVGYLIFVPPGSKAKYNYLIVDTPGFKDSRGQEKDEEVIQQLRSFLQDVDGVDELHCIGFVVNGTIARLQEQFSDIVQTFCEIFGENAKDIIRILITFSHMKSPPVLNVLECSCLKDYKKYMFDNTALKECNQPNEENLQEDIDMYKIYWNKTARVYDSILNELNSLNAVSLNVTREALEDIKHMNSILDKIKISVESYLDQMIEVKALEEQSSLYQTKMAANENWEGTVDVKVRSRLRHLDWFARLRIHAHNCEKCIQTCKYPCDHLLKDDCPENGKMCSKCSCPNESHVKSNDVITHYIEKRPVIHEDKKAAYDDAMSKEALVRQDILNLINQIDSRKTTIEGEVSDFIDQSAKISSISLGNCQPPVNYIEETLNLVKVEKLENTNIRDDQLGHVIPILDELKEHLVHHFSLL